MSREEENSDSSSTLNGTKGAAGFSTLEDSARDAENSVAKIWGTSWTTPDGNFLQPSSSLESRAAFPNFLDSSFNVWRSSSSDEEQSRNCPPNANGLFIPTPMRQHSTPRFPFPIASVDIPLDLNPFQGLPERVAREPNAGQSEVVLPEATNTEKLSSSLDESINFNWEPEVLSHSFFVGDTWGRLQNYEHWQVPDMLAPIFPPTGPPISTFNGEGFPKYFEYMDKADKENMREDAKKEAEGNSAGASSVPDENRATNLGINVFPAKRVNFANLFIQFNIQVFNIPRRCELTSGMIEAIATCPSGRPTICTVRMEKSPESSDTMQSFQGYFKATDEVGLYKLRVRLVLPLAFCGWTSGVVAELAYVLVSRNYFRDSHKFTSPAYQLQFERIEDSCITNIWGLACDKMTNRLYYTERLGNRVICMDPNDGRILFQFGKPGALTFNRPSGIACDEINRRVLVCDKDNHQVASYSMDGEFLGAFGGQGFHNGLFNYPWDIATSPLGTHIAVTDSRNKRIQLFDRYGKYMNKYSIFEKNPFIYKNLFDYPRGIAFGSEGDFIFTTDFNTQNVLKIPLDMSASERLVPEGQLRRPQGLVVDEVGTLLVTDSKNNCIRHMADNGALLSTIRYVGGNPLKHPVNLTIMPGSLIALLDGDGKIHII